MNMIHVSRVQTTPVSRVQTIRISRVQTNPGPKKRWSPLDAKSSNTFWRLGMGQYGNNRHPQDLKSFSASVLRTPWKHDPIHSEGVGTREPSLHHFMALS